MKKYFKNENSFNEQMPDEITIKEALSVLKYIEGNYDWYLRIFQKISRRKCKIIYNADHL